MHIQVINNNTISLDTWHKIKVLGTDVSVYMVGNMLLYPEDYRNYFNNFNRVTIKGILPSFIFSLYDILYIITRFPNENS